MQNQLNKIFKFTLIILLFAVSKSHSIEGVSEFTDAINEVRQEFNEVSEASTEQSKIIDEALKEIDKATEYVQEAINNDNAEDAIKTLEFIEKSLSDVESIIPQEFGTDMSQMDASVIPKEDMDVVNEVTAQMKTVKEEKLKDFMADLVDLNQKGIDTVTISENLNSLGIDTIKLDLSLDDKKKMETWTKEEWANSYKGSVLTSDGSEVIADKEINNKVLDLEQKLQANTAAILDKRSSLTELQTKIDPLSGQITDLKTQKTDLLAKYNEEILKQSSTILSDEEINKSKELADQFNSQLSDLTNQIKTAEEQSNTLQEQVQGLNLELANDIATKSQLQNNIKDLNNQLTLNQNLFSKKELELDQLKNTNLAGKVTELNDQLETVTLQRDFAQRDFDRALDKEVEAFQYYYSALGNVNADNYDIQAEYAVREVQAILNPDPKQYRAFELEKYSKLVGFSQDFIDEGLTAIANDDWDKQKSITKQIYKALEKNPQAILPDGWYFNKITDGDINVIVAEDRAIQEAVYVSMELDNVKQQINDNIKEKTKDLDQLRTLRAYMVNYGGGSPGSPEYEALNNEIEKLMNKNENVIFHRNKISELSNQLSNLNVTNTEITNNMLGEYNFINNALKSAQIHISNWESKGASASVMEQNILSRAGIVNINDWEEISPKLQKMRLNALSNNDVGYANQIQEFADYKFSKINALENFTNQVDAFNKKNPQVLAYELNNQLTQSEMSIQYEKAKISNNDARTSLVEAIEGAQKQYEQIVAEESKDLSEYKSKISGILKKIPTFEDDADFVADLNPVKLRAKLVDIASNGNLDESYAVEMALKELGELGEKPVSQYMTGPYWEASNIKTAAIVRSKKYGFVDDFEYINAYYNDPLALDTANRAELEGELKGVLGESNVLIDALNAKAESLSNELNLTKEQSKNLTTEIARLENELTSLKTSESEIQNQITDLSNQFSSKESLIAEKTQNLASLQEQLNPLSNKMSELEGQRADLDAKLNTQLTTIANQIESQGKATDEANALKAQFESQIAELDGQLKDYESQSVKISSQLASLTTELTNLESETPEIANQIESLNQDLENFINIKADLAMATAEKYNLEIQEKVVDAVKPLENKSIISIEGTNIFRVVDSDELLDNSGKFKVPTGTLTLKGEVYTAGAVQPEKLFSFAKINNDEEINGKILELEKQFEAGTLTEEELQSQRDSLNATRTNMKVEFSEVAAAQFASTGSVKGGEQAYNNSTLGSWVLVNATTGEQMTNPLTGHSGSMVCEGSVCGMDGELGKQASAFGGMYVLESLADKDGNVAGICSGGGCKFDVDTLRVLGPDSIANNVFNESGEGIFQQAFTGAELNEIEKYGMTTLQRKNAIDYAMKNNIEFDASKFVDQDSLDTQAKALAFAAKTNTFVSEVNKQAGAYVKFKTDEFKKITSTVTYGGEVFSGVSKESATQTFKVVDGQIVQKTAQEIAEAQTAATQAASAAQEAASTAQEAASAAQQATEVAQAAAQQAAEVAQEAAKEVAQAASSVITGNDLQEISNLANDALGAWVLVDAATGKQMTNPVSGHSGSIVCTGSTCGAEGSFGKEAASFGGVYVLERLADPETGNVAGGCAGGDCQFDLGN